MICIVDLYYSTDYVLFSNDVNYLVDIRNVINLNIIPQAGDGGEEGGKATTEKLVGWKKWLNKFEQFSCFFIAGSYVLFLFIYFIAYSIGG